MRWVAISLEKFETSETALRWALNRSLRQKDSNKNPIEPICRRCVTYCSIVQFLICYTAFCFFSSYRVRNRFIKFIACIVLALYRRYMNVLVIVSRVVIISRFSNLAPPGPKSIRSSNQQYENPFA